MTSFQKFWITGQSQSTCRNVLVVSGLQMGSKFDEIPFVRCIVETMDSLKTNKYMTRVFRSKAKVWLHCFPVWVEPWPRKFQIPFSAPREVLSSWALGGHSKQNSMAHRKLSLWNVTSGTWRKKSQVDCILFGYPGMCANHSHQKDRKMYNPLYLTSP